MGNYFRISSSFISTCNTLLDIPFLRMTSTTSEEMSVLNKRLCKAETQLKLLTNEIKDIKSKIQHLQTSSIGIRHFSTISTADLSVTDFNPPAKRLKTDFIYEGDYVVAFTDGSCENNGFRGAKAGLGVWFGDNHPLNVSAPVKGKATNNVGEIQACVEAVKIALKNDIKKLCIKTDSQFVINSMTLWIKRWKKNNWKLATGGDVKNKVDFEALDKLIKNLEDVRWVHVNGHVGIKGNEEADKLARSGAILYTG